MSHQQPPPYGNPPPATSNVTVVATPGVAAMPGGCPVCQRGVITEQYSVAGIILAILFFPIGVLCCLAMTERRCSNCGSSF